MRLNVRTTCWLAGLALLGGCSTAPFCDLLDRVKPTKVDSKNLQPGGGVCAQGQGGPLQPGVPIVPVTPVVPPPTPSPFFPQQETPPINLPAPPPIPPK